MPTWLAVVILVCFGLAGVLFVASRLILWIKPAAPPAVPTSAEPAKTAYTRAERKAALGGKTTDEVKALLGGPD